MILLFVKKEGEKKTKERRKRNLLSYPLFFLLFTGFISKREIGEKSEKTDIKLPQKKHRYDSSIRELTFLFEFMEFTREKIKEIKNDFL